MTIGLIRPAGMVARDATGAIIPNARRQIHTVPGPASYATGGVPVDLSAIYDEIKDVTSPRCLVTATRGHSFISCEISEAGSDLWANGKFRVVLYYPLKAHTHGLTAGGNCGAVACGAPITHASSAAGASANAIAAFSEYAAATNFSAYTIQFEVLGVAL